MKIEVIGLGKAGLPLAAVIADAGVEVIGLDVSAERVAQINQGQNPFPEEPGLGERIQKYGGKTLRATTNATEASKECNVHIILVPLLLDEKNQPDFRFIDAAVKGMLPGLKIGDTVVIETTLPVGTLEKKIKPMLESVKVEGGNGRVESRRWRVGRDVFLAYSPERLMSGFALSRFQEFPKVIGGVDEQSGKVAHAVYQKFIPQIQLVRNARTAEMIKIAEGTYRDVNIALANELFRLCEQSGVDYNEVRNATRHEFCHLHQAGLGVGGHCIPVYPQFLIQMDRKGTPLLQTARAVNDGMVDYWMEKIRADLKAKGKLKESVCVKGITYRPGVKELYHSRALTLAQKLKAQGFQVFAWDPLLSRKEIEALGLRYKKPEECAYVFEAHNVAIGNGP